MTITKLKPTEIIETPKPEISKDELIEKLTQGQNPIETQKITELLEEVKPLDLDKLREEAKRRIEEKRKINELTSKYKEYRTKKGKNSTNNILQEKTIKCLDDYRNYKNIYGGSDGYNTHEQIYLSLLQLRDYLITDSSNKTGIIDPIKYMYHLHYVENITLEEIYKKVGIFFNYSNFSSFKSLLTGIFYWKSNTRNIINNRKLQNEIESRKILVDKILGGEDTIKNFNREDCEELSPKLLAKLYDTKEKILTILSQIGNKTKEEVSDIICQIKENQQLSNISMTKIIQEILQSLGFKIKIPKNTIDKICKK